FPKGFEAKVVEHPFHLQLLMGHADIATTFGWYIHLFDVAVAHAVYWAEHDPEFPKEYVEVSQVARIASLKDVQDVRDRVPQAKRKDSKMLLTEVEKFFKDRL
nr:hypothetical protein [Pyrinomonadaceae bacterium]